MIRLAVAALLLLGWHFATTFFVPGGPPNEKGWIAWPFGQQSRPIIDVAGIAPQTISATGAPTLALVLAATASLCYLVAILALFGIVVPTDWFRALAIVGASASAGLFVLYLGPLAVPPIVLDAVVLWGVLVADWSPAALAS